MLLYIPTVSIRKPMDLICEDLSEMKFTEQNQMRRAEFIPDTPTGHSRDTCRVRDHWQGGGWFAFYD